MDPKKIIKHEFIGAEIEVMDSKNKSLIGVKGKIIDETKNMFMLENGKKLVKSQCIFKMKMKNKLIRINGDVLTNRPEDRIKKNIK
ncbi:ribonuclease P protein subunit [Candidatus Woesearchaeota archaeon]|nr:ribonuclease P protein subunit [Candidatus Woesearchaeota archaeon]